MKYEEPLVAETKKRYFDPLYTKSIKKDKSNSIEYIDKKGNYNSVSVSRYYPYRKYLDENNRVVYESYNQKFIEEKESDKYYRVELDSENRLDKIALIYYGDPRYWWIIAIANNIIDPFSEIRYDTLIRVPTLQTVHEQRGIVNDVI